MFVLRSGYGQKHQREMPQWLHNSMGSVGKVPEPSCTSLQELPVLCHGMAAVLPVQTGAGTGQENTLTSANPRQPILANVALLISAGSSLPVQPVLLR